MEQEQKADRGERVFDLEERTARFGEDIIEFAGEIPKNPINLPLVNQLVRAGTSVGANYCEADDASSKKDFRHKISLCKKEARETKHWLRMISKAEPMLREKAVVLWKEGQEIHLILAAILRKSQ